MGTRLFFNVFLVLVSAVCHAQGFRFESGRQKIVVPFQHINNLVIIPVEVNGVMLNFLLDSGVDETILFSLDEREVSFDNLEKVRFRGLGSAEPIEGLRSGGNTLAFDGFKDADHDIYIVLDQDLNFSGSIGIPVNGVIGYNLFRNFPVEISYASKKITIYRDAERQKKKWKKQYTRVPISIELSKPYAMSSVTIGNHPFEAKLLIDVGNSDALWLFAERSEDVRIPQRNFVDYLGRGFSGEIHGRRARITEFRLGGYDFRYPIAAFPDTLSTRNIQMVRDRIGSIGGEILRRFSVVLDYAGGAMYLKKSGFFDDPFQYNMSGLDIQHAGMTWVKETVESAQPTNLHDVNGDKIPNTFTFRFELKPVYSISNVREGSPAYESGVRPGDVIRTLNNRSGYRYTLQQINNLLKSEEGREIKLAVERNGQEKIFVFTLKSML